MSLRTVFPIYYNKGRGIIRDGHQSRVTFNFHRHNVGPGASAISIMFLPQFSQQGMRHPNFMQFKQLIIGMVLVMGGKSSGNSLWRPIRMDEWKVNVARLAEDHLAPVIARGRSVRTERTE